MEWKKARELAISIGNQLIPYCDRLNIAGSIRRKKPYVKDIEIVCLPKTYEEKDLFGEVSGIHRSQQFMEAVNDLGIPLKGKPSGRMMQIFMKEGIQLDLFMPQPDDFIRQFAIRTGSANYSHLMIATAWKKLGWVGTEDGLRLKEQCEEIRNGDKSKWICKEKNPKLPPVWEDEQAFFQWLQIPFLAPENRNM